MLSNPTVRLAARALIVAAGTFLAQLQAAEQWDASLLRSAVVAAALAAVEAFTPVNQLVGRGKTGTG